jgi:class 3 adenylate cyclase
MAWNPLDDVWTIVKTVATTSTAEDREDVDGAVLRLGLFAALVAGVYYAGPVVSSAIGTKLTALMNSAVGVAVSDAMRWADDIKIRVEKEAERIKGNLDWERITATFQHLQIALILCLEF